MAESLKLFKEGAQALGLELGPREIEAFRIYMTEILRWNARTNITGFRTKEDIITKGFLDSLACYKAFLPRPGLRVLDVGTGAGFPGLPLKICLSFLDLTLLEASRKKVSFLRHTCRLLGLSDVKCIWGRAEALALEEGHQGSYDVVLARAVAHLTPLAVSCLPFLRQGGLLVVPKGAEAERGAEEARPELGAKGGRIKGVLPVTFPGGLPHRRLVIVERV
ncbi:MAG: 16S rRNA (guanine(527)-N(7))-methyltransferase RsmG [candidate division NC10 bacterium]|nr:16S rRNA (guanine(527)-N(7))-methyltransferase RsmG [candidate division NC10 bacterium]